MKMIDDIYDTFKNEEWFKNMSMDAQGEFCIDFEKRFKKCVNKAFEKTVEDYKKILDI